MSAWGRFEHRIWNHMAEHGLQQRESFALAVSGGLDSMVLLNVFSNIKPQAKIKVLHYHHGPHENTEIENFRRESESCVRSAVEGAGRGTFSYLSEKSLRALSSEDDARKARWDFFNRQIQDEVLVTAHHLDDRIDTVLLKMIRGTSMDGVTAFSMWNGRIFRPFLDVTKAELLGYAKEKGLRWIEDPTNRQNDFLRNWVRNEWLPDLEKRVPGGRANLARSLFKMMQDSQKDRTFEESFLVNTDGKILARDWFSLLSPHNQTRALALFLKRNNIYEFSGGQLEEIRKRLDKNQKDLTFEMLGRKWVINATQIVLE
jgi:tRNA(Ile)-lysidine synthase